MLKVLMARVVMLSVLLGGLAVVTNGDDNSNVERDEDVGLNVIQLVKNYNYPIKSYIAVTKDEYVLTLHRIQNGLVKNEDRGVVLLIPGLLCSSVDWLNMGPKRSLGFLLADVGYDVWLMNPRGTTWSRKHSFLSPVKDEEKFWDFSWHEIGFFDLPATIDYILKKTNKRQIHCVAHSQGATAFLVMASTKPEYNKKVKLFTALAPIAFLSRLPNVFFRLVANPKGSSEDLAKFVGSHEFHPDEKLMPAIGKEVCEGNAMIPELCSNVIFLIGGYNSEHIEPSKIPVISTNTPAGGSMKQFRHYIQVARSKDQFSKYDYGELENLELYGTPQPSKYKLGAISVPVAIYYSSDDQLATSSEVARLQNSLDNVVSYRRVPVKNFGHYDFLWAKNAAKDLYRDVIAKLKEYV